MAIQKIFSFLILLSMFASCGDKSSRRVTRNDDKDKGEDHRGVEGLNEGRKALYDNLINLTKEGRSHTNIFEPLDGESFSYIVKFSKPKRQKFKLEENNKECLFEYTSLRIDESMKVENEEFIMNRIFTPIEPVYIGLPIGDRKRRCIEEQSRLTLSKKGIIVDLKKQAEENRKMIREYFLNIIKLCEDGKEIPGIGKCDELEILNFEERADGRRDGDSVYYFESLVTSGKEQHKINIVFSLRDISWGFGGLLLWESKSSFKSNDLKLDIISLQADSSIFLL